MKALTVTTVTSAAVCAPVLGATAGCGGGSKAASTEGGSGPRSTPTGSQPPPTTAPPTPQEPRFSPAQAQAGLIRPAQMGAGFDISDYTPSAPPSVHWTCGDKEDGPDKGVVAVPDGGTGFQEGLYHQQSADLSDWQPFTVSQIAIVYPDTSAASAALDKIAAGTASCTSGTRSVPSTLHPGTALTVAWKMDKADAAGWNIWRDTQDGSDNGAYPTKDETITDLAAKIASIMKAKAYPPTPDFRNESQYLRCGYEELSVSVQVYYGQYADLRQVDRLTKALAGPHAYPDLGQGAYWDDNPHGSSLNVRVGDDGLLVYVTTNKPGAADQAAAIAKLELNP